MLKKLQKELEGQKIISVNHDGDTLIIKLENNKILHIKIETRVVDTKGKKRDYPWLIIERDGKQIFEG